MKIFKHSPISPSILRNPRLNNHFPEHPYQEIHQQALNPYNNIAPYQKIFKDNLIVLVKIKGWLLPL